MNKKNKRPLGKRRTHEKKGVPQDAGGKNDNYGRRLAKLLMRMTSVKAVRGSKFHPHGNGITKGSSGSMEFWCGSGSSNPCL
jgi:hypothetical protein